MLVSMTSRSRFEAAACEREPDVRPSPIVHVGDASSCDSLSSSFVVVVVVVVCFVHRGHLT